MYIYMKILSFIIIQSASYDVVIATLAIIILIAIGIYYYGMDDGDDDDGEMV